MKINKEEIKKIFYESFSKWNKECGLYISRSEYRSVDYALDDLILYLQEKNG